MAQSRRKNQLLAKVFGAFPALAERWGRSLDSTSSAIPWSLPRKPLRQARLAVVSTGGLHLRSQPAFDMSRPEGDATLREVPADAPREALTITHDYYDHRDAERDLELIAPTGRLGEWVAAGALGALHPTLYSLMGHIDGSELPVLERETAPALAERLRVAGVDYVLLVPA